MTGQAHDGEHARIALLHAMSQSMTPIADAFARTWPEAEYFHLLDDTLARDLDRLGRVTDTISERVATLARYAVSAGRSGTRTAGMILTGTAFGPAAALARRSVAVPFLLAHQAAFAQAAAEGTSIGLLLSFEPSVEPLAADMRAAIRACGSGAHLEVRYVAGALEALRDGDAREHDRLIAAQAGKLDAATIVLGQFSMARAADTVTEATGRRVVTTPDSAVRALRSQLERTGR